MSTLINSKDITDFKSTLERLQTVVNYGKKVPFKSELIIVDGFEIQKCLDELEVKCIKALNEAMRIISEKESIYKTTKAEAKQRVDLEIEAYKADKYSEIEKQFIEREQKILANEEKIRNDLKEAETRARKIISDSEAKSAQLLDEHEIIKKANEISQKLRNEFDEKLNLEYSAFNAQRQEMMQQAMNEANAIRENALQLKEQNYNNVMNVTKNLESALANYASQLRSIRNDLSNTIK